MAVSAQQKMQQVDDKKLAQLAKSYEASKKAFQAKNKDAKVKTAHIDATVSYGMGCMYSVSLPPREKYKKALVYFREALKLDPKNKLATENKSMIESIYKQMGRPVPGGN
jgi:tetratricopeptide (TPR) repeat protein